MAHWLLKSEPETWSWDDQVRDRTTKWDGVRNHQAANNLKAMKRGENAFFYHSGAQKSVVGIVEVIGEHRPDPSDESGKFVLVEVAAVKPFVQPVTLQQIKAEPRLSGLLLVRNSRLSVVPVGEAEWRLICQMGQTAG